MVKKIVKRAKVKEGPVPVAAKPKPRIARKPKPADPYNLQIGEAELDDDAPGGSYWKVEGTPYYVGYEDRTLKHFVYDPNGETGWETLPGFVGFQTRTVLLRNLGRFMARDTEVPEVKTTAHPKPEYGDPAKWKAYRKIALKDMPVHPRFPVVHKDLDKMLPKSETYLRWDPREKRVASMVTVDADGVAIAWISCRVCSAPVIECRCPHGVTPPAGIVWCCERAADGWSDEKRTTKSYIPTTDSNVAGRPATSSVRPGRAKSAPVATPVASKPAEATTDATVAALDAGNLDLGALSEKAAAQAAADTKSVRRVIKKKRKATK